MVIHVVNNSFEEFLKRNFDEFYIWSTLSPNVQNYYLMLWDFRFIRWLSIHLFLPYFHTNVKPFSADFL